MALPTLLTRQEILDALKISLSTLNRLEKEGRIRSILVGGSYRYEESQILALIASGKI